MGIISKNTTKFLMASNKQGYNAVRKYSEVVEHSIPGIEQLTLIAESLPEKYLSEVFTRETLEPLIMVLLQTNEIKHAMRHSQPFTPDARRLNIAIMLVELALELCMQTIPEEHQLLARGEIMKVQLWAQGLSGKVKTS